MLPDSSRHSVDLMHLRRTLIAASTALATLSALVSVPVAALEPTDLQEVPDLVWDVGNPDMTSRHTNQLRAMVRDLEEFEGHMYVAGKFQDVIAPNGLATRQPYLARFDLETGEWDQTFRPVVDDIIYSIEITNDGRLFVGGEMDGGAVLYNARSGARIDSFDPQITNSWGPPAVFDVEVIADQVYLGGDFTEAQGTDLSNLARVDANSGALDESWTPTADFDTETPLFAGSLVFAIEVDASRNRVYLAGKFGGVNGNDAASYFAVVRPSDGALVPGLAQGLPAGIPSHRDGYSMWMEDVQFDGNRVYVGGNGHQTMTLRASDLAPLSTIYTNNGVGQRVTGGDTQVIHVGETTVWAGCHCWSSVGPFELGSYVNGDDGVMVEAEYEEWVADFATTNPFGQQDVNAGYGFDRVTGELSPFTFDLAGQAGAYAIVEDSLGRLWLGGQFTNVASNGRTVNGLVRFSVPGQPAAPVEPAPSTGGAADDQITRLYQAVFGRAPDAEGFAYWTGQYAAGVSLESIATSFTTSPEWASRYGSALSNAAFVDAIYQNVLGRPGDPEGQAFWLDAINSGRLTRVQVLLAVSDSPENIAATGTASPLAADEAQILRLYQAAFGRSPDASGFAFWVDAYRNGQSLEAIAGQFTQSDEWSARFGVDPDRVALVEALYLNVLDRLPDATGEVFWVEELEVRSVASVLVSFSESPENIRRTGTNR